MALNTVLDIYSFNVSEYEAPGKFRYIYTWVWGYRDDEVADMGPAKNDYEVAPRVRPPLWESSPSPASALITAVAKQKVLVTVPPHPPLLGFGDTASKRYQKTGWRARIYRRRESIDESATSGAQ